MLDVKVVLFIGFKKLNRDLGSEFYLDKILVSRFSSSSQVPSMILLPVGSFYLLVHYLSLSFALSCTAQAIFFYLSSLTLNKLRLVGFPLTTLYLRRERRLERARIKPRSSYSASLVQPLDPPTRSIVPAAILT